MLFFGSFSLNAMNCRVSILTVMVIQQVLMLTLDCPCYKEFIECIGAMVKSPPAPQNCQQQSATGGEKEETHLNLPVCARVGTSNMTQSQEIPQRSHTPWTSQTIPNLTASPTPSANCPSCHYHKNNSPWLPTTYKCYRGIVVDCIEAPSHW
jgi:hypothetical protein